MGLGLRVRVSHLALKQGPELRAKGEWSDNFLDGQLIPCTVGELTKIF